MNGLTSNVPTAVRVLTGPVIWLDGGIGRVVGLSDGSLNCEGWDARSKSWVRDAFHFTSFVTGQTNASPADLAFQGITD